MGQLLAGLYRPAGESGLGLETQRKAVDDYLNGGSWTLAAEFVEVESGKRSDNRPQLAAALAARKKLKARLIGTSALKPRASGAVLKRSPHLTLRRPICTFTTHRKAKLEGSGGDV